MFIIWANRYKAVVAFKQLDHWLADSYLLRTFQVMRLVLANRIKGVVAFRVLEDWLADSY